MIHFCILSYYHQMLLNPLLHTVALFVVFLSPTYPILLNVPPTNEINQTPLYTLDLRTSW